MATEFLALTVALLLIALIFIPTVLTGASPVPTSGKVRAALLALAPERLPGGAEGRVYELGAGWGGMALALARKYPDRQVTGYEISPVPWAVARLRQMVFGQSNLRIVFADYRRSDLSDAALVLCYLTPEPMEKLRVKLERELKPGALVLSNTFSVRGWRPLDDKVCDDIYKSHVYLYEAGNTQD